MVVYLTKRRTSIEPLFNLIAKVIGIYIPQKQLPVQRLDNVRACLALATLSVQIAIMARRRGSPIADSIWGLPHRNISEMASAFQ